MSALYYWCQLIVWSVTILAPLQFAFAQTTKTFLGGETVLGRQIKTAPNDTVL